MLLAAACLSVCQTILVYHGASRVTLGSNHDLDMSLKCYFFLPRVSNDAFKDKMCAFSAGPMPGCVRCRLCGWGKTDWEDTDPVGGIKLRVCKWNKELQNISPTILAWHDLAHFGTT